jgi:hypothetical protein
MITTQQLQVDFRSTTFATLVARWIRPAYGPGRVALAFATAS